MIIGRDVELRARLARLLKTGGYRVETAESASHARRIGFAGIALAIVAPDGRNPVERSPLKELRAEIGNVLLAAARGSKRDPHFDLLDVRDENGLLARVAETLAVSGLPRPVLAEGLDALVASGLAFRRGVPPDANYISKHALMQEATYETLPRSRRVSLHATTAAALEREPESAPLPELLAHHYAQASMPLQAVHYLLLAGSKLRRGQPCRRHERIFYVVRN